MLLRLVARTTPHRFRPKTPESFGLLRTGSASPLGEGEDRRPGLTGDDAARWLGVVGSAEEAGLRRGPYARETSDPE